VNQPTDRVALATAARMQLANAAHCLHCALPAADLIGARAELERIMREIDVYYRMFVDMSLEERNDVT
jgi:hypothetical protein